MSHANIRLTWQLFFAATGSVSAFFGIILWAGLLSPPASAGDVEINTEFRTVQNTINTQVAGDMGRLQRYMAVDNEINIGIKRQLGEIKSAQKDMRTEQKAIRRDISQILRLMINRQPVEP